MMSNGWIRTLAGAACVYTCGLSGCTTESSVCNRGSVVAGSLTLCNAVAPAPLVGADTASQTMSVYLEIENTASTPDTLVSVTSDAATVATLHSTMNHDGHAMTMAQTTLVVPAKSSVSLAPGETHVMLEQLTRAIRAGDSATVTLQFAKAGRVAVPVRVVTYQTLEAERSRARVP